jgi:TonB family protein
MALRPKMSLFLAFCSSIGAHGVAYASLSAKQLDVRRPAAISEMEFELPPLPAPEPDPQPPAAGPTAEPASLQPAHVMRSSSTSQARPSTPTVSKAMPSNAGALDLSGVTLTNDSGSGFAMPLGDGSALHGAIGSGTNRGASTAASPAPSAAQTPALVDASDLSARPTPPSLAGLLRENYPEQARQRGLRGSASLRARIDADGVIRNLRVLSESSAGFGSACRRTVLGSRWSAPRDKNGRAVATEIVYTCHFEVDQ